MRFIITIKFVLQLNPAQHRICRRFKSYQEGIAHLLEYVARILLENGQGDTVKSIVHLIEQVPVEVSSSLGISNYIDEHDS